MIITPIPESSGMSNADFLQFSRDLISGDIQMPEYSKPGYRDTIGVNLRRFDGWQDRIILNTALLDFVHSKRGRWN